MRWFFTFFALCVCFLVMAPSAFGQVNIGGVVYDYVDPGPAFTERVRPAPDWQAPQPTQVESEAGLLAYVTSDPGYYKPDSRPRVNEHAQQLSTFLTPGEERAVWFGVSALTDISSLSVSVKGKNIPVKVDVKTIHFWPQRTGWGSRQWYMTPELLLACKDGKRMIPTQRGILQEQQFDLKSGNTAGFWLTLSAAKNAKPGTYNASVTVQGSGRTALKLPLGIEILPFKLKQPKHNRWLLYADEARWKSMSDAQVLKELGDFRSHGFVGLVELTLGTVDLTPLKSGGELKFDAKYYRHITALCRKAGLPGPHVINLGGTPERVADALGLKVDLKNGDWPAEVKKGVEAVARAARKATKHDAPWYYYGVDEPSGDNTYAIQDYQCWCAAGADTYATVISGEFLSKSANYISSPCFVAPMITNQATSDHSRELCEKAGAEYTWYGTGCYVNAFPQEQYMYHNRYGAGFYFWKTGAINAVAWTFCRPHEDVFNDFDGSIANQWEPKEQVIAYPHFLKPDDWSTYQGAIPTIAWESHREGCNDYKYIYTLSSLISEKERSRSISKQAAKDARTKLAQIVNDVPWANLWADVAFDPSKLLQARKSVADMIVELNKK